LDSLLSQSGQPDSSRRDSLTADSVTAKQKSSRRRGVVNAEGAASVFVRTPA